MDEVEEAWARRPEIVGGLVVGGDGSLGSAAALEWALRDAARRGCPVHVVRAWMLVSAAGDVPGPPGTVPSMQECADATQALLEVDVAKVLAAHDEHAGDAAAAVPVTCHAVHGPAGPTLVAVSAYADLLVVGHRGRGYLAGLLLGSVAEYALRRAACSVVVVR